MALVERNRTKRIQIHICIFIFNILHTENMYRIIFIAEKPSMCHGTLCGLLPIVTIHMSISHKYIKAQSLLNENRHPYSTVDETGGTLLFTVMYSTGPVV